MRKTGIPGSAASVAGRNNEQKSSQSDQYVSEASCSLPCMAECNVDAGPLLGLPQTCPILVTNLADPFCKKTLHQIIGSWRRQSLLFPADAGPVGRVVSMR